MQLLIANSFFIDSSLLCKSWKTFCFQRSFQLFYNIILSWWKWVFTDQVYWQYFNHPSQGHSANYWRLINLKTRKKNVKSIIVDKQILKKVLKDHCSFLLMARDWNQCFCLLILFVWWYSVIFCFLTVGYCKYRNFSPLCWTSRTIKDFQY